MALPSYLPKPGQQFFALPYFITKAQMLGLVFQTDPAKLARNFIDPVLNAATPGRFQLMLDGLFVLGHVHYPLVTHSSPQFGGLTYNETVIYLALHDTQAAPGAPEFYWFTPIVILDSYLALIAGREIFGFPKVTGTLSTSAPLEDLFQSRQVSATVSAECFATTSKEDLLKVQKLWSWNVTGGGPLVEDLAAKAVEWVFDTHLFEPLNLLNPLRDRLLRLVGRLDPGLFLKEFPATQDTALACYRGLVRASYTPTAVHRLVALSAEAAFESPASFPVANLLGFPPGTVQRAEFAFIAEMDWKVPGGEEFQ